MSLAVVISGVPTHADTGMAVAPVSWDAPPAYVGPDVHLVGVLASIVALQGGAKVYPGHGGLEVLLFFESLNATDLQDLDRLMGGDVADCLPSLRLRVAPASFAVEVNSIAGQRELAALLGQFPPDRLAERMINSLSFIRRLLVKIRHLQAASMAEDSGTLSSETLVASDIFDAMRREWTAMCRHWSQRVRTLKLDRINGEDFLRQGRRDADSRYQTRITELTDQATQLQAQLRGSEAARQASEERVLDVNALVDFLMGNKPNINVMFNWMRLAALLHHFAEGSPIPEGWLTNINVVALDDPRCECPEYAKPLPRPGNGDSSSSSRRPSDLDLSPPARNKRASTSGSRAGNRKRKASGARNVPMVKRLSLSSARDSGHQLNRQGIDLLAPREAVCQMLTQVIHAGQLDESPWCRFVPEGFYTSAEETLRLRQAKREPTPPWHPLDPSYELSQAELDKAARAEAAADNDESSEGSDGAETESKPAARHLSPAGLRESKTQKTSDKGSGSKSHGTSEEFEYGVTKSTKSCVSLKSGGSLRWRKIQVFSLATFLRRTRLEVPYEGLRRIRSKLAKLNYDDPWGEHLDMVETVCRETHVSYRIFGILVKFDSYRQAQGDPDSDFEPHKPEIHILKGSWDLEAYQALVYVPEPVNGRLALDEDGEYNRAPWSVMFHYRVTVFYFHEVRDGNSETLDGVKDYVDFMRVNAKPWWAILHWLTISFLGRDAAAADASRDLYEERRRDVKRLRAQYEALLKWLFAITGFRRRYSTSLWTLHVCACHWILKDPDRSPLIRRGVADYAAQFGDLDAENPVRTQWAAAHSDNDILVTVPTFIHSPIMQPERRARNVIPLSAASQA
ncbi:hypothetical protein PHMEG_00025072 [Phytophthora megakarya]|uniref:Uncharacterized protein n=1 Tax=Phytophthora megakarya TaxID=4795 RepID=A0A225VCY2_9STRA|nr:hypothetical protein PHMEG_00025072 [Phytophthora megakarya]